GSPTRWCTGWPTCTTWSEPGARGERSELGQPGVGVGRRAEAQEPYGGVGERRDRPPPPRAGRRCAELRVDRGAAVLGLAGGPRQVCGGAVLRIHTVRRGGRLGSLPEPGDDLSQKVPACEVRLVGVGEELGRTGVRR